MKLRRKNRWPGVVASVEQQTAEAAALAQIAGQRRLTDPRTNPAVRAHADQLRNDQHRRALDAEHSRLVRRHRVEDRRAEHAEETLEAIQQARQTSSPARSVLALHTGKRRYLRLSLAASLALAAGSAMGVEATAEALRAPTGSGYIAEVGLTGLATAAITYRAHLAEHRGELAEGSWQSRVLWVLMTVPLLASVACNLAMLNVVGAFCAIGAAAFSLLSCVIADRSAAAMQARAEEVTTDDEADLRVIAMGDDLFTAVQAEGDEPLAEVAAEGVSDTALGSVSDTPPEGVSNTATNMVQHPVSDTAQNTVSDTVPDTPQNTPADTARPVSDTPPEGVSNTGPSAASDTEDINEYVRRMAERERAEKREQEAKKPRKKSTGKKGGKAQQKTREEVARDIYDAHMAEHHEVISNAKLREALKEAGHPTGNRIAADLLVEFKAHPLHIAS